MVRSTLSLNAACFFICYGSIQILPDMFDDYSNLRPLKETAMILANDDSWGQLFDLDQLARNEVKVTCAT